LQDQAVHNYNKLQALSLKLEAEQKHFAELSKKAADLQKEIERRRTAQSQQKAVH